jgi:hypothetical protein
MAEALRDDKIQKLFENLLAQMSWLSSGGPGGYSNPRFLVALSVTLVRGFETTDGLALTLGETGV